MKHRALVALAIALATHGCTVIVDAGSYVVASDAGASDGDAMPQRDAGGAAQNHDDDSDAGADAVSEAQRLALQRSALALAEYACSHRARCESRLGDGPAVRALTLSLCHPTATRRSWLEPLLDALSRGRIVLEAAQVEPCLAALSTSSIDCEADRWAHDVPACQGLVRGTVPDGGSCALDVECAPGLVCAGNDAHCPGSCRPPAGPGDRCDQPGDCASGLSCIEGACGARVEPPMACASDQACAQGSYCAADGSCAAPGAVGEPCELGHPASCAADWLCVQADGGTEPRCGPGVAPGDLCSEARPCALGARCADDRCVLVSAPGGHCDDSSQCPPGGFCRDGRCAPRPTLGESCDVGAAGACIEGICSQGRCTLGGEGAPCRVAPPFAACEGYCSDSQTCVSSPRADGEPCQVDHECEAPLVCVAAPADQADLTDLAVASCALPQCG